MDDNEQTSMSESTTPQPGSEPTRAGEPAPIQRRPRQLPRRGYEEQRRTMSPPPPPLESQRMRGIPTEPPPPLPPQQPPPRPVVRGNVPPVMMDPRPGPRRRSNRDSGLYLPWWSLVILVVVAGVSAFGLLWLVMNLGSGLIPGDQTPQVIVVTNALPGNNPGVVGPAGVQPTAVPGSIPATSITVPSAVPAAQPTETSLPGVTQGCPLNATVEVVGTEGLPLLIRVGPSQVELVQAHAEEGEWLRIVGGPQTSTSVGGDELEWCQVEGVTVPSRDGWAARQFLSIIEE